MTNLIRLDHLLLAYHEAGHSVVATALGARVVSAVVDQDALDGTTACDDSIHRLNDRQRAAFFLAGITAEAMVTHRSGFDLHDEAETVLAYIRSFLDVRNEDELTEDAVRAWGVAFRQRKTVSGRWHYCLSAGTEASSILIDHWSAVEGVASNLIDNGSILGDRVRRIVAEQDRLTTNRR